MSAPNDETLSTYLEKKKDVFTVVSAAVDTVTWCALCVVSVFVLLKYLSPWIDQLKTMKKAAAPILLPIFAVPVISLISMIYVVFNLMVIFYLIIKDAKIIGQISGSRQSGIAVCLASFLLLILSIIWSISYQAILALNLI